MEHDLTAAEVRVLGALLEKQRLTPDAYPLTLNALRAACNQTTSRDPVVEFDEATVRDALARLTRRGWTRLASGAGSRAPKYRHLLGEQLGLTAGEQALLAALLLRGAQTAAELRAHSVRTHDFADVQDVHETLDALERREMVRGEGRRPGQKEERFTHRLAEAADDEPVAHGEETVPAVRVDRLEAALATLRGELDRLRGELDRMRGELGTEDPYPPEGEAR